MMPVKVVGMGLGLEDLSPRLRQAVDQAQVLAGGRRLLALFPEHPGRKLELAYNLETWLEQVADAASDQRVAVLASGDPGFHGIAARLVERLGFGGVEIYPNLSSVQAAFARLKEPWEDAALVSLHGHGAQALWPALARADRVAVLTEPKQGPDHIARLLIERGVENWEMAVAEDLGGPDERVGVYDLPRAAVTRFSPLNLAVLRRTRPPRPLRLGAPEEAYEHAGGLITKSEVRAVALGLLELGPGMTLWDLGAGCGSLGIEASLLVPGGRVLAVERQPERVEMIKANRRRYEAGCLEVVQGELPQAMEGLPAPDRVFVGGGGAELPAILAGAAQRLPRGGVLVAAVVLLASLETARQTLGQAGLETQVSQAQVSRSVRLGNDEFLRALNPVWLVKGVKE